MKKEHTSGFTLIEIIIIVVIISILTAIVATRFPYIESTATANTNTENYNRVLTAVEIYAELNGAYPDPELSSNFCNDTDYFPNGCPNKPIHKWCLDPTNTLCEALDTILCADVTCP